MNDSAATAGRHGRSHPARPGAAGTRLPRFLLVLGGLAGAWVVVLGIHEQSGILGPLFLTLNLYIVAYPVQHRINDLGAPKLVGAVISGLIVLAILLAFFGSLAWAVAMFVQEIPQYQGSFITLYAQLVDWLHQLGISETQLLEQAQRTFSPSNIVSLVQSALSSVTGVLSVLLITVTIIFVALIDSMTVERRARALAGSQPTVATALVNFAQGVRRYWIVSSIFGLIVAVLDIAVLMYLGVPLALVWGVLSFLTNYIPNVGFVLGLVPPAIMALIANDPMTALLVVVAYSVINFVVQSVIQPKFTGESVGVTASVSLLSLLFWSWALGPLGAILGLPATLLVKSLLIDIDPSLRWLNAFIASDPEQGEHRDDVHRTYGHDVDPIADSDFQALVEDRSDPPPGSDAVSGTGSAPSSGARSAPEPDGDEPRSRPSSSRGRGPTPRRSVLAAPPEDPRPNDRKGDPTPPTS